MVEKAIPNIIHAVKTVVCLSKDEFFRRKCLSLIKVKLPTSTFGAFISLLTFTLPIFVFRC